MNLVTCLAVILKESLLDYKVTHLPVIFCFRAIVEKYLLEKSRIVSQTENER